MDFGSNIRQLSDWEPNHMLPSLIYLFLFSFSFWLKAEPILLHCLNILLPKPLTPSLYLMVKVDKNWSKLDAFAR
jgi:hypothetical protein